ncbi:hypothetical protein QGM71_16930 [Virgibacillus sp. C22-A2]|uniref:Uncharacterized protein n=1 Tax=Virgibacillus tibetensis TaxID=3042313 RepID=A0ABU6KIM5_9BACI|nr:hypothetical protein [Virgibacillus sp. C22-A2]
MQAATISNYTTSNRIGVTETQIIYHGQGMQEKLEVPKAEVSLDDLFSGDTFYGDQMRIEYDMWKAENPDQDFSFESYRMAAVNMNAFEYESIKGQQFNKEFWVNIGALVVIVGATVICPPAALALGAVYGSLEITTAVSGKDWISGRELNTGERWFRGALAPLDIIPGVAGMKKFSSGVRVSNQAADMGQFGLKAGVKTSFQRELNHVGNLVIEAGKQSQVRLQSARNVLNDTARLAKDKLARDAADLGRLADTAITNAKNITSTRNVLAFDQVGQVKVPVENTHFFENKIKGWNKAEGVNIKGTGEASKIASGPNPISNYDDFYSYEYNSFNNPGALAEFRGQPNKNFYGGRYNMKVLTEPKIFYRAGDINSPLGQWFTETPPSSVAEVRIDTAVKEQWIDKNGVLSGTSRLNTVFKIEIPAGTTIYKGPVGNQGGIYQGGLDIIQIYIKEPWNIEEGVSVIGSSPLK